jgi:hypothetical protein
MQTESFHYQYNMKICMKIQQNSYWYNIFGEILAYFIVLWRVLLFIDHMLTNLF